MATVNAFRAHVLRSLGASSGAASAVCKRVGVSDVNVKGGGGEEFISLLGTALSSVPLEKFDNAVRESSGGAVDSKLRWDLSVPAIEALASEVITRSRQVEDAVAAIAPGQHTWENTVLPLADQERFLSPIVTSCDFLQHVSGDKKIRHASMEADKKLNSYFVDSSMRKDVFDSLLRYRQTLIGKESSMDPEDLRLLERMLRDFRRNGLELDEAKRDRINTIQKEISDKQIEFQRNLGEEDTKLKFSSGQLEGMPQDFIDKLHKDDDGRYLVTLKYPDVVPIMKLCKVETTRKELEFAFNSRCKQANTMIIERLLELRHEKALLLGFPDHATYVLDVRMAKSPITVRNFLTELSVKLQPLADAEMAELIAMKRDEKEKRNESFDGKINMWDYSYYLNMREMIKYDVDHEALKQYFPLHVVKTGVLEIYQTLLSLKFTQIPEARAWHEDVSLYSVHDLAGKLIGYFYLDLHPREGKYGHAAVFGLQAQCDKRSSTPQLPVAAMVANFSKPSPTAPSLLRHNETVTLLHEFGHVMHQLCSNVQWAMFSGTRVERDFVECPSQLLENWCWEASTLSMLSGHVDDNSKKIPANLLDKLVKSKTANAGLTEKRQILFGMFDQTIHSRAKSDTKQVLSKLHESILGITKTPGTNFAASFGHIAGGYDAQYYGYMWSSVYSMDMFAAKFQKGNLLDPKTGMDYREMILAKGGSRDAIQSVREFLGREPNQAAFLLSKGLSTVASP